MIGTGLRGELGLKNMRSDRAVLSLVERLGTSIVFIDKYGSQIYKQDKDFLLKETVNLENKIQQDISDEWKMIQVQGAVQF